jgi:hypothetical protein
MKPAHGRGFMTSEVFRPFARVYSHTADCRHRSIKMGQIDPQRLLRFYENTRFDTVMSACRRRSETLSNH